VRVLIRILFKRSDKAFLPEVDAYVSYFNKKDDFRAYDSSLLEEDYDIKDFDVLWEFKGFGGDCSINHIIVHEYASLSTGLLPRFKNFLKSKFNPKPDLRVFLNENVKNGFNFNDEIEFCYRDMGIDESFLLYSKNLNKEYDFVYVGAVSKNRGIDKLLENFTRKNLGKICLIGNVDDELYKKYKHNKDFIFTGKVKYNEVPKIASKAVYGINYVPDKYPYNLQTSTKLLEYLALGLKVITTDYWWIRNFENKYNCSFYKVREKDFAISRDKLERYNFSTGSFDPKDFLWDRIINKSGVEEKLFKLFRKSA